MKDCGKIAVLLSAYNGEMFIAEQIDSILQQDTEHPVHLFVRDDASQDGTCEILKRYAAEGKLTLLEGEHIGLAASFFSLLAHAYHTGVYSWIALADQDDVWLSDKLRCAVEMLESEIDTIPLLYGSSSLITDHTLHVRGTTCLPRRPITFSNSFIQNITPGHSQVMNAAMARLVLESGMPEGIFSPDHFLVNMAVVRGKLLFDPVPHTLYRQHGKNKMGYRSGFPAWFFARTVRIRSGEGHQIVRQMHATAQALYEFLSDEEKQAVGVFLSSQSSFSARLSCMKQLPFYRQRWTENMVFRLYYLLGGYR